MLLRIALIICIFVLVLVADGSARFFTTVCRNRTPLRLKGGNSVTSCARPKPDIATTSQPSLGTNLVKQNDGEEIIVPTDFTNVDEALEHCHRGDRLFVRAGAYQWHGMAVARGGVEVTGEEEACLLGRWMLFSGTCGRLHGISCAYRLPTDQMLEHACITVSTSQWNVSDSEIRSVGTASMRLMDEASIALHSCNLGGLEPADSLLAKHAIIAMHASRCALSACGIDDTGDPLSRPERNRRGKLIRSALRGIKQQDLKVAGGIRAQDRVVVSLDRCRFSNNDVSVHVAERAVVTCTGCAIRCGEFACFAAGDAERSRLELWGTELAGQMWLDSKRPETVVGDHDDDAIDVTAQVSAVETSVTAQTSPRRRGRPSLKSSAEQQHYEESVEFMLARHGMQAEFDDDGHLIVPPGSELAQRLREPASVRLDRDGAAPNPDGDSESDMRWLSADSEEFGWGQGEPERLDGRTRGGLETVIGGGEGEGLDSSATAAWGEADADLALQQGS